VQIISVSLKIRILLPLALVALVVFFMSARNTLYVEDEHLSDSILQSTKSVQGYLHDVLLAHAEAIAISLEFIAQDRAVLAALKAGDREALLSQTAPLFERLRKKHNITHFYFHNPKRINLLRVHKPERHGDLIDRFTALQAEQEGKLSQGIELGPLGTFTLRVVIPVFEAGQLLGYIELGKEIDEIVFHIHEALNVDLYMLINKQYLDQTAWETGMQMLGRPASWDQLPSAAVISQSRPEVPLELFNKIIIQGASPELAIERDVQLNDHTYWAGNIPLNDAGGRHVGSIVMLRDVTSLVERSRVEFLQFSLYGLLTGLLMFGIFYLILGRTERRLIADQTRIVESEQRMGRILEHSWDEIYVFSADSLRFLDVSEGACRNLGYPLDQMKDLTAVDLKPEFSNKQFESMLAPLRSGELEQLDFETIHKRKDGSTYPVEVRLQYSKAESPPVFVAIIQDISERNAYIKELEHKALHDSLTDLPNRNLLQDHLRHEINVATREVKPLALAILNMSRFQEINNTLGRQNGDLILQQVAKRLITIFRKVDTVARIGGDEFAVILPNVRREKIPLVVKKIQNILDEPFMIEDMPIEVDVSIGIALYPEHGEEPETLLRHSDVAARLAKIERNGISIYDSEQDSYSMRRLTLVGELRHAISDGGLSLHYQPKVDIKTSRVTDVEALVRWQHPSYGMISPVEFIPLAEQTALIKPLTMWVLNEAIRQQSIWQKYGLNIGVAINLSTRNLIDTKLPEYVASLLDKHGVAASTITLEITESTIMAYPETCMGVISQLKELGTSLSIDDFGTGYSSLSYLSKLPVSELKIDQSFIFSMLEDTGNEVIVRSTIDLGHNLDLKIIAEGVENIDVWQELEALNCDKVQGYYVSRPLPPDEFLKWYDESGWGAVIKGPDIAD